MAIQMRRGKIAELDTSLVQSGELLVATDTDFVAYAKGQSDIVQLASKKDVINAVQSGTLVDVTGKKLIFRKNRSQPTVSFIRDFEIDTTYDVEYGNGRETVEFGIKEFMKCCKPQIISGAGVNYDNMINALKSIVKECKLIVSDTEYINVSCTYNTSGTYSGTISVGVYHGSPRQSTFRLSSKNTYSSNIGRFYYSISSPYVVVEGRFENYRVYPTGEYDHTTNDYTSSVTRLGVYATATNLAVSNLGLKTDRVINDNDWEWDFSKMTTYQDDDYTCFDDLVDGLRGRFHNSLGNDIKIEDEQLVITGANGFADIPYLFQAGRTVEIDFGICERSYTQTQSQGKNYALGQAFGNYVSNASQYANPYVVLEFPYYVESQSPKATMRIHGLYDASDPVEINDPNILSENKLISKFENGRWTISVGGSTVSYEYSPITLQYSRVGKAGGGRYDYALYTTRIKKIKVN